MDRTGLIIMFKLKKYKQMRYLLILFVFIVFLSNSMAQKSSDKGLQSITAQTVEAPLKFLASDWTEGRELGTKGAYMAADYIASLFQLYDIKPLGDMDVKRLSREPKMRGAKEQTYRSYFQNFDLLTGLRKKDCELQLIKSTKFSTKEKRLIEGSDYQLQGGNGTIVIDAPTVFLGYGLKSEDLKSDPFKKIDLNGKIVFLLSGFPGVNNKESENYKTLKKDTLFSVGKLERDKIENARKAGALAVVRYNPNSKFRASSPSNLPMHHNNGYYEGDQKQDDFYLKKIFLPNWGDKQEIPVIQINKNIAESILADSGDLLPSMQKSDYDISSFKATELVGSRFRLKIVNDQKVIRARNVLGYIEGKNPNEVVVIGGHYDHVGKYNGFIFNGADDNVSGTVGVLSLARAFKESGEKPEKTIVFAAWTAEEMGLWGSKYFVKNIPDSLNVILNINLDMIGRTSIKDSSETYLSMVYTTGHEVFEQMFKDNNKTNNFDLDIRYRSDKQPKGGSDFAPFAAEGIPVISITTGLHRDYHMPNDELESIDLNKMAEILKLTYLGLNDILKIE
jgi:hypothetical protein